MNHEIKSVLSEAIHILNAKSSVRPRYSWRWLWPLWPVPLSGPPDGAQPTNQPAAQAPAEKPAPLPLHQIEGNGGIFSTLSLTSLNRGPRNGEPVGRPQRGICLRQHRLRHRTSKR